MLEHILSGIGGAAGGYLQEKDRQDKMKLTREQMDLQKEMIRLRGKIESDIAVLREEAETGRNNTREAGATTRLGTQLTSQERQAGIEDATKRFIAEGGFANNTAVARLQAETQRYGYDKSAETSRYSTDVGARTAGNALAEGTRRWNFEFPMNSSLAGYKAETDALRPVAGAYGAGPVTPDVPSLGEFESTFAPRFRSMTGQEEPPPVPNASFGATGRNGVVDGRPTRPAPLGSMGGGGQGGAAPRAGNMDAMNTELAALAAKPRNTPQEIERMRQLIAAGAGR